MANSLYGTPTGSSLYNTGFGDTFWGSFYGDNPQAGYQRYLNQNGVNSFSQFGRFAQGQYGSQYQNYLASAPEQGGSFTDYLTNNGGFDNLQKSFRGLSPSARGERPASSVGRVRYVGF